VALEDLARLRALFGLGPVVDSHVPIFPRVLDFRLAIALAARFGEIGWRLIRVAARNRRLVGRIRGSFRLHWLFHGSSLYSGR
jgi:hypothetical protein